MESNECQESQSSTEHSIDDKPLNPNTHLADLRCQCFPCHQMRVMPIFECAWEVANKIGGIHTVLETKSKVITKIHPNHYFVGPFKRFYDYSKEVRFDSENNENESNKKISDPKIPRWLDLSIKTLKSNCNIGVYLGTWLIPSRPRVILIDYCALIGQLDAIKYFFSEATHCSNLPDNNIALNDCLMFGSAVGQLLDEIVNNLNRLAVMKSCEKQDNLDQHITNDNNARCIVQCHEWSSGTVIVYCKKQARNHHSISTIFTTHATSLGRYLSSDNCDIYSNFQNIDSDLEAAKRNIYFQHCVEKASIHLSHVFTTVSGLTARECSIFHHRDADFITPNGIIFDPSPFEDKLVNDRSKTYYKDIESSIFNNARSMLLSFTKNYFMNDDTIDFKNVKFAMISGRCEYRNKGIDIFIESLARLNYILKLERDQSLSCKKNKTNTSNINRTLVVFIIVPSPHRGFNKDFLETIAISRHKQIMTSIIAKKIQKRYEERRSKDPDKKKIQVADLIKSEEERELENLVKMCSNNSKCGSITTHNIINDDNNPIIRDLRRCKLLNRKENPVKIVYHPEFVDKNNIVFSMDYKKMIKGCDIGVFPSFYEPWGYTPVEFMQEGKLCITSDLSGFGEYVEKMFEGKSRPDQMGIGIVKRRNTSIEDSVNQLTNILTSFIKMGDSEISEAKKTLRLISQSLDWRFVIEYYEQAMRASLYRSNDKLFAQFSLDSLPRFGNNRDNFLNTNHLKIIKTFHSKNIKKNKKSHDNLKCLALKSVKNPIRITTKNDRGEDSTKIHNSLYNVENYYISNSKTSSNKNKPKNDDNSPIKVKERSFNGYII